MTVDVRQLESLNRLFMEVMGDIFLTPLTTSAFNDITSAQKKILYHLGLYGSHKMSDIARQVAVSVNGATGIVDKLVKCGLVERESDPADRRVVLIKLTDCGRRTFQELNSTHERRLEEVLGGLDAEKRHQLVDSFERIHTLLSELRAAAPPSYAAGESEKPAIPSSAETSPN